VLSHWALDAFSHLPDLPLAPWSGTLIGLGLWNSVPATVTVELMILAAGVVVYLRSTKPAGRAGSLGI